MHMQAEADLLSLPEVCENYVAHPSGRSCLDIDHRPMSLNHYLPMVGFATEEDLFNALHEAQGQAAKRSGSVIIDRGAPYLVSVAPRNDQLMFSIHLNFGKRQRYFDLSPQELEAMLPLFENGSFGPEDASQLAEIFTDTFKAAILSHTPMPLDGFCGMCDCIVFPDGTFRIVPAGPTLTLVRFIGAAKMRAGKV